MQCTCASIISYLQITNIGQEPLGHCARYFGFNLHNNPKYYYIHFTNQKTKPQTA